MTWAAPVNRMAMADLTRELPSAPRFVALPVPPFRCADCWGQGAEVVRKAIARGDLESARRALPSGYVYQHNLKDWMASRDAHIEAAEAS